ncbi:TetR/AcrR family transcriptional regulator [Streptacidiphilus neutrinimicus]|uniref:TetR/AcrR family transcriptional regulator n=1 Tax=Streptacidiphilus neutrinimicus TaxID=105420 RepID=UPI0005A63953|nr:TetR/AcrR family transcriptional regulator [Streptacidiphilus neutrinimicus]
MTDQTFPRRAATPDRRPGKRERLVAAAVQTVHEQGVEATTLADIAKAADVPVGGVYYYFKTKDDVVAAVIDAHSQQIRTTLGQIESRHSSPKSRLKALVAAFVAQGEAVARFGCPLGSLCSELDKRPGEPSLAAELMRLPIEWAERQFHALGRPDAHDLAVDLLAAYEGSALLANTLHDSDLLTRAAARIGDWIDAL